MSDSNQDDRGSDNGRATPTAASAPAGRVTRRRFVATLAAATGALALGSASALTKRNTLPNPNKSGLDHIVVVMMENRSFDHYLGWLPNADGRQAGLSFVDRDGVPHETHALAPEYQGCAHPDPDHSYEGGRVEFNDGACDGWLGAGDNDLYAIGYYTEPDLAFFGPAMQQWTACDRYFSAILAPTFPNRIYQHAAQTDRLGNTVEVSSLRTIWDRLADQGIEGRYYFSDIPVLALWGSKYVPIGRPFEEFLIDCASDSLPAVSFVDPRFLGFQIGASNDDHPHADIRNGQTFMASVYRAITLSPAWQHTLLVYNYDEWGGFFDHVPPPLAPIPKADQAAGNADGRLGFRVPCLVVAPWVARGSVAHTELDHTSILKLIEWRFGLGPLSVRDKLANNLAEVLDFSQPDLSSPQYSIAPGPFGSLCDLPDISAAAATDQWLALKEVAERSGWPMRA